MVPAGLCAYRDLRRKRARKWGDTVTQPDDPRRVGVIVELIDHTIAIAKLNERGDLVQRLTRARQRRAPTDHTAGLTTQTQANPAAKAHTGLSTQTRPNT